MVLIPLPWLSLIFWRNWPRPKSSFCRTGFSHKANSWEEMRGHRKTPSTAGDREQEVVRMGLLATRKSLAWTYKANPESGVALGVGKQTSLKMLYQPNIQIKMHFEYKEGPT